MTDAELKAFLAKARAELDARQALLDATDRDSLPPALRAEYDDARADCDEVRAMIEDEAVRLQVEAAMLVGRDLTLDQARALVRKQ